MRGLLFFFGLFVFLLSPAISEGHPISVSDAYVEVHPDRLDVRLEVFVEDLYLFHKLPLNEQNALPLDQVAVGAKLHTEFLKERFKIITPDGTQLKAELQRVDDDDLPDHAIPFAHLMFFRLIYEFTYSLDEPAEFLTFLQDFTPEEAVVPSEVMVKIKPLRGRRLQNTLLPDTPWTVRLENEASGDEPSQSESPLERAERLRQETLGIASYGQTYAFLYLEPEQTRLEVLVPLATLAGSLEKPLQPDGRLDVDEQEALKGPIEALVRKQLLINLDGKPAELEAERVQIFGVTFTDFSQNVAPQPVSVASARVGLILTGPAAESGQLTWNLFNQFLYQVRLAVIRGEETSRVDLRQIENDNVYRWSELEEIADASESNALAAALQVAVPPRSYLKETIIGLIAVAILAIFFLPVRSRPVALLSASLLLIAGFFVTSTFNTSEASLLKDEQPETIFTPLLEQIYAAFNQREEEQVYDQLDAVVDGPMLRELYLEIRRSMAVEEQGGAIARAGNLELLECEPTENTGSEAYAEKFRCRWQVEGTVEHWGHIHSRTTTYLANLTIAPRTEETGTRWKLTNINLINQQQSVLETDIRQF